MSRRKQAAEKEDKSESEIMDQGDAQLIDEVQNVDSAFNNLSIPPYMVRRYVNQLGLARKKAMAGGLGFDGNAYAAIALTYSFIMSKLGLAAKETMNGKKTLTNEHILAGLQGSPDLKRLLPTVYIGGVGVIPEDTLVRIQNTRVGSAVLEHNKAIQTNRHNKLHGGDSEAKPDEDLEDEEDKSDEEESSSSSSEDEEAKKAEEELARLEKAKAKKALLKEKLKKQKEDDEKAKKKAKKPASKGKGKTKPAEEEKSEEESVADRAKNRRKRKATDEPEAVPEEEGRRVSKKAKK